MYLDLNILETNNLKTIALGDNSVYDAGQNVVSPTVEITPPGFQKVTLPFTINSINVYNSISLKITPGLMDPSQAVNLPDGYWQIRYSVYPNNVNYITLSFMKIDNLKLKYHNLFLYLNLDECDVNYVNALYKELTHIRTLIQGIEAAGTKCNMSLALSMYDLANKRLDKVINDYKYGVSTC